MFKFFAVPIHKEGYMYIAIAVVLTFFIGMVFSSFYWVGSILTLWCVYFFRNPIRYVPQRSGLVVSPADGVITAVTEALPPKELEMDEEPRIRISVFLSVFDVHVNRNPVAGVIKRLLYVPGKFLNATLDKASDENERQYVVVETADKQEVIYVQIAGLIARRIVCQLEEDQEVQTGSRFGIIRFGSRMDVYLPHNVAAKVGVGQRVIGGETVFADLNETGTAIEVSGE